MTRLLVVDDNPQDRLLVRRALVSEFEDADVSEVPDQPALDEALAGDAFDAVVTDFRLRWNDGLKVLEAIHARHPETPVVMFTNTGSEEVAASGLRQGLSDYIIKAPGQYARVAHAVRHAIQRARLRRLEAELLEREHHARVAAEDANRLKDEFLATVSHELRTPLHAITGWLHVLKTQEIHGAPLAARAVNAIERNAMLLGRVVEDLMDNTRILSGKLTLLPEATEIEEPLRAALEGLQTAAAAKQIAVSVQLPEQLPQVWADPERLQQIFWNLLSNAVKFTPEKGRVAITAARDGRYVAVTVTDSGHGISAGFLPYVFDRFTQEDSGTTRAFPGLGLGLALVRQLVEAHGGTVTASSPGQGQGATFVTRLPVVPDTPA